jgi:hypothetical protein
VLYPIHIATRGRLDGEWGIATRGYIICPDIVPRFPEKSETTEDGDWAVLTAQDYSALLRDFPKLTFEATLLGTGDYAVRVDGTIHDWDAEVTPLDYSALVMALGEEVGAADEDDLDGSTVTSRDIGAVTEEDETATVVEVDDVVGDADDVPPHC